MKRTLFIITAISTLFLLISCQSTKTESTNPESDVYSDSDTELPQIQRTEDDSSEITIDEIASQQKHKATNAGEFFANTLGSSDKYLEGEEVSVFILTPTGGVKQANGNAFYHKKDKNYGFGTAYSAAYYYVFFDEANLNTLSNCYKQYLSDFSNKKLERQSGKTIRAYGKINSTLNWGPIKTSTPNKGKGQFFVGYKFIKGSPYFCLTLMTQAENDYAKIADAAAKTSMLVSYYFTKSQMEKLLENCKADNYYKLYANPFDYHEEVESDSY